VRTELSTELAAVLNTHTDVGTVIADIGTINTIVAFIKKMFVNKRTINANTQVIYDDDSVTPIVTQSISKTITTVTRNKSS
jgi:hypothetical protein